MLVRAARLLRLLAGRPRLVGTAAAYVRRFVRRAGGLGALRHRIRPMTFVMHRFMDAEVVAPAWQMLQRGETATDPQLLETQQRLRACVYSMAHPETGEIVPACVQHSLLDADENRALAVVLPLPSRR